jgi:hypothetical protein
MSKPSSFSVDWTALDIQLTRAQDCTAPAKVEGSSFYDEHGRTLLMRGINLCGNSKLPTSPPGSTHLNEGFFDHQNVSFVGRPFPLNEAKEHFARLRTWGLTLARLLVPWEALGSYVFFHGEGKTHSWLEHAGPGIYDDKYIEYLVKILDVAQEFGIKCFIDPHQDCVRLSFFI